MSPGYLALSRAAFQAEANPHLSGSLARSKGFALEGIRSPNLLIRSYSARCGVQRCEGAGRPDGDRSVGQGIQTKDVERRVLCYAAIGDVLKLFCYRLLDKQVEIIEVRREAPPDLDRLVGTVTTVRQPLQNPASATS
jgi:hypothetical protein